MAKKEKEKNSLGATLKHPRKPIFQWLSKLSVEGEISRMFRRPLLIAFICFNWHIKIDSKPVLLSNHTVG